MTKFPEVYVMKSYQIQKLRRREDVFEYMQENEVENDKFEKCLKHLIMYCQFKNNIFAIMHKYKDAWCKLKHILGTIFVSNPPHYGHIAIDLQKDFIFTKDPMGISEIM